MKQCQEFKQNWTGRENFEKTKFYFWKGDKLLGSASTHS